MRRAAPGELGLLLLLIGGTVVIFAEHPPAWARIATGIAYFIAVCQWTIRQREQHMRELEQLWRQP